MHIALSLVSPELLFKDSVHEAERLHLCMSVAGRIRKIDSRKLVQVWAV